MLGLQRAEPTILDVMSNSFQSFYEEMDGILKASEVVPNTYQYVDRTSYGNTGKIQDMSVTQLDIIADAYQVVSIDNSYIHAELTTTLHLSDDMSADTYTKYYVGFKSAPAIMGEYNIYSNEEQIHRGINAHWEWMLAYDATPEEVKDRQPQFATLKKIREMNPDVPGIYIDLEGVTGRDIVVTIPVNIPLNSFLMFNSLKYIPNWFGKIRLDPYFARRNLVFAPVIPASDLESKPGLSAEIDRINNLTFAADSKNSQFADIGFHQINIASRCRPIDDGSGNFTFKEITITADNASTDKITSHLAVYTIKPNVYTAVEAEYASGRKLIFPYQTLEVKDFTEPLSNGDDTPKSRVDTAMTVSLNYCHTMFVYFGENHTYSTQRFLNPMLTNYQFKIDGIPYPMVAYDSIDDPRTKNMIYDALNINGSDFTGLPTDARTSGQPYTKFNTYSADGKTLTVAHHFTTGDWSNYCLGVPFADNEAFQGGISTGITVQIQLIGDRNGGSIPDKAKNKVFQQPTAVFVQDGLLKISAGKIDSRPQIDPSREAAEVAYARNGMI